MTLGRWLRRLPGLRSLRARHQAPEIPPALWQRVLLRYPFLSRLDTVEQTRLLGLCADFLDEKEFDGADGLAVTDEMALAIAAQACLPLLHIVARPEAWGQAGRSPLVWYSDFVGIVVHPAEVVARRKAEDAAGVVHEYDEVITGEAMEQGPVMLSWSDIAAAGEHAENGYNLVIHEFAHKIDMADGAATGCPALHAGFLGAATAGAARARWRAAWEPAYEAFREKVIVAERFSGDPTWLDPYGAEAPAEFFAVACEAYFVHRSRFSDEFPGLMPSLDAFFGRPVEGGAPR